MAAPDRPAGLVRLAYGDHGLDIRLPPDRVSVIEPRFEPAAPSAAAEIRRAVRNPVFGPALRDRIRGHRTLAISICDSTRPQPRQVMLKEILDELDGLIAIEDVVVLVATGTHRANTPEEILSMLGPELTSSLRIVNHDARDSSTLTWRGMVGEVPVWLNDEWCAADFRITTGFVEPHFFAGFSGGPKLVAPGLAGLETVLTLHDAKRIGHPSATWGICEGNPVHDDIRQVARQTGVDFALDVILNRDQAVVAAYAGDVLEMHAAARERSRAVSMRPVPRLADAVVTSNAGYPLDQNLYQAVKGMSAAMSVTRPGGLIICAAECRDGFPEHGSYKQLLQEAASPQAILDEIAARESTLPDQWQVQVQAKVQTHATVGVHSDYLSDADLLASHLKPVHDIAAAIEEVLAATGEDGLVYVLPEGPLTIPYVA